jgi:hypothetical protein
MHKSFLFLISLLQISLPVVPATATDQSTVLNFPDKSMGRVDIIKIDSHCREIATVGRVRASGVIRIPSECRVGVVLNYYGGQHIDWLSKLPINSIYRLDCNAVEINDENLSLIGKLKKLVELNVERTNLSDADARHLTGLTELRKLILNNTALTPEGLKFIEHFTKLEVLKLASVNAGGMSKVSMKDFASLRVLDLGLTNMTNNELKKLTVLPHIEDINLNKNNINDDGIEFLVKLKGLRYISLVDTRVTARGLRRLAQLPKLGVIVLRKSRYAPDALLEAQKLMPHVTFQNDDREFKLDPALFAPLR